MVSTAQLEIVTSSAGRPTRYAILVHGGAGDVPAARVAAHVAGCERAAEAGARVLESGGSALDAVHVAVEVLESDPLFNAGTGACLNAEGHIELDAAIMEGTRLCAGGVGALPPFLHPVAIARRVMEASPHVLLVGEGAARFAVDAGFSPADEASMITENAVARLQAARARLAVSGTPGGTVGAVARDERGRVAAATSTGGMVNKLPGRVGDSPVIGAGTYADDEAGACSTTGDGEGMLRLCVAKSTVDAMRAGAAPDTAASAVLARLHARTGRTGGVIAVDAAGTIGLARTTRTMTWAYAGDEVRASGA